MEAVGMVQPLPALRITTSGSSHYWGDLYKDLQTGWLQLASLREIVVSETTIPAQTNKVSVVVERTIDISNITLK
jgi:predicted secreted protein